MHSHIRPAAWRGPLLAIGMLAALTSPAAAQLDIFSNSPGSQGSLALPAVGEVVSVRAEFTRAADDAPARLFVIADVSEGWHIYSITQPRGGPIATTIRLEPSEAFRLAGDFRSHPEPHQKVEPLFNNLTVETHEKRVVWHAPVEWAPGVDPATVTIAGRLKAQACDASTCRPPKSFSFTASLGAGVDVAPAPVTTLRVLDGEMLYKSPASHTTLQGYATPSAAAPGGKASLAVTAMPDADWHVYALADRDPKQVSKPALIVLEKTSGLSVGRFSPDSAPTEKPSPLPGGGMERFHGQPVTWTADVEIPADLKPGDYRIVGLVGYQSCSDQACDLPKAARFEVVIPVRETSEPGRIPLQFAAAKSYREAAERAEMLLGPGGRSANNASPGAPVNHEDLIDRSGVNLDELRVSTEEADMALPLAMALGFLGGLILNLMPCVLPVIGLKILSFVEQAGQERSRVLALNIVYSLGMMAVFMVLATLAVFYQLGWGKQNSYGVFTVTMTAVVFVMALSFLGVWEIPIPGFVGSGKATKLAAREGMAGAFSKGVLTTILATPCSGPFLAPALTWAAAQPMHLTYTAFASVGLGMASPYLLIGAFPALIRFLPKPGAWMETFKQLMGFVLLATVVYLLTTVGWERIIPTVALLFGLWAACWWIGRISPLAERGEKLKGWAAAVAFTAAVWVIAFPGVDEVVPGRYSFDGLHGVMVGRFQRELGVYDDPHGLPWQQFSLAKLEQLTGERKTVMIDFTADWCLTCKSLEKLVLNTPEVREVIDANGVVPLIADWTESEEAEEVTAMLDRLGSRQIPVLAIFPAGSPNEPIVLRGGYTQGTLLEKLGQAGPSTGGEAAGMAMNAP